MNNEQEQILVLQLLLLQQRILQLTFIKGLVRDELVRLNFQEMNGNNG